MAVTVVADGDGLHVRLTGWESVFAFARRVEVCRDDIVSARVMDWDGVRAHYGGRLRTAYLLRGRAGGWFMVTKGRQHLVWCWLHRGEPALIVRTERFRPGQVAVVASAVQQGAGADWLTQPATP